VFGGAAASPAPAASTGGSGLSHTWEGAGKLGLTLKQRGDSTDAPDGVLLSDIKDPNVEKVLREKGIKAGMIIEEAAGVDVTKMSYTAVMNKIKGAGRPLTMKFGSAGAAPAAAVPASGGLFGAGNAVEKPAASGGLFGSPQQGAGGSLFGATPAGPAGGSLFGAGGSPFEAGVSLPMRDENAVFGGAASSMPAGPTGGGSIFGASAGGSVFGGAAASPAPAAAPAGGSIFGASAGGSVFGGAAASPAPAAAPVAPAGGSVFGTSPPVDTAAGSLFGSSAPATAPPAEAPKPVLEVNGFSDGAIVPVTAKERIGVSMSCKDVGKWIHQINFGDSTETYEAAFLSLGVEGDDLPFITDQMLETEIGMRPRLHRMKLLRKRDELCPYN